MKARNGCLALILAVAALAPLAAQAPSNARMVELAEILGKASDRESREKILAIQEVAGMGAGSGLAAGLLFDRANIQFEADPAVRETAALALVHVADRRNRMTALRLGRIANPLNEPEPKVRMAALRSLAACQSGDAAAIIYESARETKEPDAGVRACARELIEKGLAGNPY